VSFDNERVGKLQAQALLEKLTSGGNAKPKITMINGSPTDNNATLFKNGAHSVLDGKVDIVKEDAAANWKPEEAQQLMEQFIAAVGKDGFDAAYQANDGTAGGAIAAMKAANIDPKTRPTCGQDAEVAAIQRILSGEQYVTVYKAIQPEAEKAAQLAVALTKSEHPRGETTVRVAGADVPSFFLPVASVRSNNVEDTVVKDKFYGPDTVGKICADYKSACAEHGIG
jgi:D-xylose transport system substrate-binding protein